jgi:S-adenosylmethionine:tRNA ribosyltransferase-isomerase
VDVAVLTHAAGLSATGDPVLDDALPLPERYEIPEATVAAITDARAGGGRVVAVGTTVVRALEGSAASNRGRVRAGAGVTDLRIGSSHRPQVVDGLLSGIHDPGSSHFELLTAFAPRAFLESAAQHAEAAGYLAHEFGDACLVLPEREEMLSCGSVSRHARDGGLGPRQAV